MVAAGYEGGLHKLCSQRTQRRLSSTRALPSRVASRTPLYEWHRAAGARLIEFGGWKMPLQYSGIVDEHLTARQAVGLFDVSHMGKIFVEGPTAHTFLDHLSANDVPTSPGKARYTHLLREDGTILDDVIVTCLAPDRFLLVCNAGPRNAVWSWLKSHATADVVFLDRTLERLCLALQGPRAPELLQRFTSVDLSRVKLFAGVTIDFVPPRHGAPARERFHRKSRGGGSRICRASPCRPHGTPPLPVDGPRSSSRAPGTRERRGSSSFRRRPRDRGSGNRSSSPAWTSGSSRSASGRGTRSAWKRAISFPDKTSTGIRHRSR